eukprot:4731898-Pyramimonas_sp.AAC.1
MASRSRLASMAQAPALHHLQASSCSLRWSCRSSFPFIASVHFFPFTFGAAAPAPPGPLTRNVRNQYRHKYASETFKDPGHAPALSAILPGLALT